MLYNYFLIFFFSTITPKIQSAHFGYSKGQISLHTVVVYVALPPENKVETLCFCTASENLRHDPPAISGHLIPICEEILKIIEKPKHVHIVSDGPTGQYRQKLMFYCMKNFIANLLREPETLEWHFEEAGHGKENYSHFYLKIDLK